MPVCTVWMVKVRSYTGVGHARNVESPLNVSNSLSTYHSFSCAVKTAPMLYAQPVTHYSYMSNVSCVDTSTAAAATATESYAPKEITCSVGEQTCANMI